MTTIEEHRSNLETLLATRGRIVSEINRVAQAGNAATTEAVDLLQSPSAFDDSLVLDKITALRTKSDVAVPVRLERLQADLYQLDSQLGPAIEETVQAALRVMQAVEEARYQKFKAALALFFDGGLAHKAFHHDPHGITGPVVRGWFVRTDSFLSLDFPRRSLGGLSSRWSPNPPEVRAAALLSALPLIPSDDAPPDDESKSVLTTVAKVAAVVLAAVGLR
jgi:hypothetical protein